MLTLGLPRCAAIGKDRYELFKEFRETQGRKYFPIAAVIFALFVVCILFFFLVFSFPGCAQRPGDGDGGSLWLRFSGAAFAYLLRLMCKYFGAQF